MTAKRPRRELAARRAALESVPLFGSLCAAEIEQVLGHTVLRRVDRGTLILRKGDPPSGMLVVLQGSVRVTVTAA